MRWSNIAAVSVALAFIIWYEWPQMKTSPKKDKAVFIILLSAGFVLSLFDLRNIPGPTTLIETVFKPLSRMLE